MWCGAAQRRWTCVHERPTSAGGALTEPHRGGVIVGSARMCSDGVEIGRCDAMAAAGRWATSTSGAWRSKHGSAGSAIASDAPLTLSRVRSSSGATVAFHARGSARAQPNGGGTARRPSAQRRAAERREQRLGRRVVVADAVGPRVAVQRERDSASARRAGGRALASRRSRAPAAMALRRRMTSALREPQRRRPGRSPRCERHVAPYSSMYKRRQTCSPVHVRRAKDAGRWRTCQGRCARRFHNLARAAGASAARKRRRLGAAKRERAAPPHREDAVAPRSGDQPPRGQRARRLLGLARRTSRSSALRNSSFSASAATRRPRAELRELGDDVVGGVEEDAGVGGASIVVSLYESPVAIVLRVEQAERLTHGAHRVLAAACGSR